MISKTLEEFDKEEILAISVTTVDMTQEVGNGISPATHTFGLLAHLQNHSLVRVIYSYQPIWTEIYI